MRKHGRHICSQPHLNGKCKSLVLILHPWPNSSWVRRRRRALVLFRFEFRSFAFCECMETSYNFSVNAIANGEQGIHSSLQMVNGKDIFHSNRNTSPFTISRKQIWAKYKRPSWYFRFTDAGPWPESGAHLTPYDNILPILSIVFFDVGALVRIARCIMLMMIIANRWARDFWNAFLLSTISFYACCYRNPCAMINGSSTISRIKNVHALSFSCRLHMNAPIRIRFSLFSSFLALLILPLSSRASSLPVCSWKMFNGRSLVSRVLCSLWWL